MAFRIRHPVICITQHCKYSSLLSCNKARGKEKEEVKEKYTDSKFNLYVLIFKTELLFKNYALGGNR